MTSPVRTTPGALTTLILPSGTAVRVFPVPGRTYPLPVLSCRRCSCRLVQGHRAPLWRRGTDARPAHGPADLEEMLQVRPAPRQTHDHPPRAGDHFRGDFDQSRPPGAGEPPTQG